ncbi:uncharacterized protein DUF222 [Motilibacter peucedani]|uniref:Uncharacterized protein DUF222 n=1 Tax=Motilibacter peucedani TaxID=598650 RepID=A0A420XV44_9ACTN|nr:HNH endonuclease signature motif containing protein [Motilibacter peucedani]RKS80722.1 uncharacterized protein DUF222 [Motilibacter peucedani]
MHDDALPPADAVHGPVAHPPTTLAPPLPSDDEWGSPWELGEDAPDTWVDRWAAEWSDVVELPQPVDELSAGAALAAARPSAGLASLLAAMEDDELRRAWAAAAGSRLGDPSRDLAELEVGLAQAWDRALAWVTARREAALARAAVAVETMLPPALAARWQGEGAAAAELAAALRISPRSIAGEVNRAERLLEAHPGTAWLLREGLVSPGHARAVREECAVLTDPALVAAVESTVLRKAPEQTAPELRRATRRAVARLDPDGEAERHELAVSESVGVSLVRLPDALVQITAVLPAPAGQAVMAGLDRLVDGLLAEQLTGGARPGDTSEPGSADGLHPLLAGPGEHTSGLPRRRLRADALALLMTALDDPDVLPSLVRSTPAQPAVHVTVSLETLLGLSDAPGELAGYGPVPAPMARALAADGAWRRLVTDPLTGTLVDLSPHTYRPGARLRAYVVAADQHCSHPGCSRPATDCDLDHIQPFDHDRPERGGATTAVNLAPRCRRDHNVKTWFAWTVTRAPDGTLVHRTPLGRAYTTSRSPLPTAHLSRPGKPSTSPEDRAA